MGRQENQSKSEDLPKSLIFHSFRGLKLGVGLFIPHFYSDSVAVREKLTTNEQKN